MLDRFYSWTSGQDLEVEHVAAAGGAHILSPGVPAGVQSMWAKLDDRWKRQRPGGGTQRGRPESVDGDDVGADERCPLLVDCAHAAIRVALLKMREGCG